MYLFFPKVLEWTQTFDSEDALTLQDPSEQRPFKVSFTCSLDRATGSKFASTLESALQGKGLKAQVRLYTGRCLAQKGARMEA